MAESGLVQVDQTKCTQCGLCVSVCRGTLGMGKNGPEAVGNYCIACGHCVAVCPNEALSHRLAPLEKQVILKKSSLPDAESVVRLIRSRRSVRTFQEKCVPRETIRELLDIARFAPSACNSQGISYHVVDDRKTIKDIAAAIADWADEDLMHGALGKSPWSRNTANTIRRYRETGEDTILRNAPCLIIALAEKSMSSLGRDNTHFALTYTQLLAPTLGLGTCWSGLFEQCSASEYAPLIQRLRLPESKIITGALIVGYPVYSFKRLADRNPLQISWE